MIKELESSRAAVSSNGPCLAAARVFAHIFIFLPNFRQRTKFQKSRWRPAVSYSNLLAQRTLANALNYYCATKIFLVQLQ